MLLYFLHLSFFLNIEFVDNEIKLLNGLVLVLCKLDIFKVADENVVLST